MKAKSNLTALKKNPVIRFGLQRGFSDINLFRQLSDKLIKQICCVFRAGAGFGVELNREPGLFSMFNSFHRTVIRVFKPHLPSSWQGFGINRVPMILGSDVTPAGLKVCTWLVGGTVAVFQFISVRTNR